MIDLDSEDEKPKTNEERQEFITKLLHDHASALFEHCDSVQIFVTWRDPSIDGTNSDWVGKGNVFASFGVVYHWLIKMKASIVRREMNDGD
jgi:hypothetical protein